jgi:hypothetical protein
MEINRVLGNILPVVATDAIVEGSMVCLTTHTQNHDFGSKVDLAGVKVPATAEEAKRAKFVISFAEDNRPTPIYQPTPSFNFAMRKGWDQAANVPFSTTVYLTQPGHMIGQTIPSGVCALAFGNGTYTVVSGMYVDNASILPGALLAVDYEDSKGKLKYQATMDDSVVAFVEAFDSTTGELTFTSLHF